MIVLNHIAGTKAIRPGAKAYLVNPNHGNGAERIEILVRSRGGRYIRKWESIVRLANFRHVKHAEENKLQSALIAKHGPLDIYGPELCPDLEKCRQYWLERRRA